MSKNPGQQHLQPDRFTRPDVVGFNLDRRAIPISQVQMLVETMLEGGFPVSLQLKDTGITEEQLKDPACRITYRQRIKQLENMLSLRREPGFWLETLDEVAISDFGLLGYAMMSSATLEQAIQIAVKYHRMAGAIFELTFTVEDTDAVLRVDHSLPFGEVAHYVIEDLFRGISPLISLLIRQDYHPTIVRFNYSAPDAVSQGGDTTTDVAHRYMKAFGCEVEFDSAYCEYRFDSKLLAEPLAEADSNTARICAESCQKLLDQMDFEDVIISRVSHLLLSTPGEFPKLEIVAHRLSLGARTLRRRLNQLGTSYQKILDDVRRQLAVEYLQATNLSVQEVSELLGYSEVTNFRRAFLKWVGLSPYQYRKQFSNF
jgi:AraC-like DNA-binding protein